MISSTSMKSARINIQACTQHSRLPVTKQLQPIRTSQLMFCTKNLKSGHHVFFTSYSTAMKWKTCWLKTKTLKSVTVNIHWWQETSAAVTIIRTLKSDSNQCAFHQSTQYYMVVGSKACQERSGAKHSAQNLLCLISYQVKQQGNNALDKQVVSWQGSPGRC